MAQVITFLALLILLMTVVYLMPDMMSSFVFIVISLAYLLINQRRNSLSRTLPFLCFMIPSWHNNAFHIIGPFWGESTGHSDSHMELEVFIDGQSNYWSLKYFFNIQNLINNLRGELFYCPYSQTVYDCICVASDHLFGNHRRSMGFVPSQFKFRLPDYVYRVSVPIIRIMDHYLRNDYP